jgi:hypothetical protein
MGSSLIGTATLLMLGVLTTRLAYLRARRHAILTSAFWQTFPDYPLYRLKRLLLPGAMLAVGALSLAAAAVEFYFLLRAFYAARLGHPFP